MTGAQRRRLLGLAVWGLGMGLPLAVAAPAQPLSSVVVHAVRSERHPQYEMIAPGQAATRLQHGGRFIEVVTRERGYGYHPHATVSGRVRPMLSEEALLEGRTMRGRERRWDATGGEGGLFQLRVQSADGSFWNTDIHLR
jgi:hypothetical protein